MVFINVDHNFFMGLLEFIKSLDKTSTNGISKKYYFVFKDIEEVLRFYNHNKTYLDQGIRYIEYPDITTCSHYGGIECHYNNYKLMFIIEKRPGRMNDFQANNMFKWSVYPHCLYTPVPLVEKKGLFHCHP